MSNQYRQSDHFQNEHDNNNIGSNVLSVGSSFGGSNVMNNNNQVSYNDYGQHLNREINSSQKLFENHLYVTN